MRSINPQASAARDFYERRPSRTFPAAGIRYKPRPLKSA